MSRRPTLRGVTGVRLTDVVAVLEGFYEPGDGGSVGRGRAGLRRPRGRGPAGAVRRRPGRSGSSTRPWRGTPTCWSPTTRCSCAGVHGVRGDHGQGPPRPPPHHRRVRPARRPHQRRQRRRRASPTPWPGRSGSTAPLEPLSAGRRRPGRRARGARTPRRLRRSGRRRAAGAAGRRPGRRRPGARWSDGSRSAAERATTSSTRCGPAAPTSTSRPTCATTRRPRLSRPAGRRSSTPGTGPREWPWLADAEARLLAALGTDSVETRVSTLRTDPWTRSSKGAHAERRSRRPAPPARRRRRSTPGSTSSTHRRRTLPELAEIEQLTARPRRPCATGSSPPRPRQRRRPRGQRRPRPTSSRYALAPPATPAARHRRGHLGQGAGEPAARDRLAGPAAVRPRGRRARDRWSGQEDVQPRARRAARRRRRPGGARLAGRHAAPRRDLRRASTRTPATSPRVGPRSAASTSPEPAALYEKLRAKQGGVGAAALRRGQCEGCRLQLNSTELGRDPGRRPGRGAPLRGVPPDPGAHAPSRGCEPTARRRGRRRLARQPRAGRLRRGRPRPRDRRGAGRARPSTSASRPTTSRSTAG